MFLDFDGVLNSFATIADAKTVRMRKRMIRDESKELWGATQIDPRAVRRLNTLLRRTGAQVVVSSTWRKLYSLDELRGMLKRRGLRFPERLIDVTPELWRDDEGRRLYRGHEIQSWLDEHPEVTDFVILDDDSDMVHLKSLLVKTSMETGLLDAHVDAAIAILGEAA